MAQAPMKTRTFQLQFAPSQIRELSARYSYRLEEEEAIASGKRIARGEYTRGNLETIFEWKTGGRGKSRLRVNTDEEIEEALRTAAEAKAERTAVSVLSGLYGVEIPVASAVLTAIAPEDTRLLTIVLWRRLERLGPGTRSIAILLTSDAAETWPVKIVLACANWTVRSGSGQSSGIKRLPRSGFYRQTRARFSFLILPGRCERAPDVKGSPTSPTV
jgi:hypothetical protein